MYVIFEIGMTYDQRVDTQIQFGGLLLFLGGESVDEKLIVGLLFGRAFVYGDTGREES